MLSRADSIHKNVSSKEDHFVNSIDKKHPNYLTLITRVKEFDVEILALLQAQEGWIPIDYCHKDYPHLLQESSNAVLCKLKSNHLRTYLSTAD